MSIEQLLARARAHLLEEPDTEMRAELDDVLARATSGQQAALAELEDRFDGGLSFGTAGLRGRLGSGSNRVNRCVVMRAAWGLGQHLLEHAVEHGSCFITGYCEDSFGNHLVQQVTIQTLFFIITL